MTVSSVVVVGGGIAGVSTVAELRKHGYVGDLTLLSADPIPYDRPPLSKEYLAGRRDLESIALQAPEWYAEQRIDLVGGTVAVALRPDTGEVELSDGRVLTADRIVLATGGRAVRPSLGEVGPSIHVLREVGDADGLRTQLVPGARLLIVGAGLIGAEVASTARGLGAEVVLVDPLAPPLAAAVGTEVATWLHGLHTDHGVEALTTTVETLLETRTGVAAQLKGEPDSREFDAVLLAVGLVPETGLAESAGLDMEVQDAARRRGRALRGVWGGGAEGLAGVLAERGYEPVADEGGAVLRMRNCPFHAVAELFPPLVCGMNLALLEGLVEGSEVRVRMDPRPGWCCVAADVPQPEPPSKNNAR